MFDLNESIAALTKTVPPSASQRVVVFRYDKIGDLIVSSPLFRAIKEKQPNAYVVLVCSPYNRAVLENMPEIDLIVAYDSKAAWRDKLRFAWALRRLKPTAAFVLSPSSGGHWMGWLSGAANRAGLLLSYRRMQRFLAPILLTTNEVIDRASLDQHPDSAQHQSAIVLRLAARCGFPRPAVVAQSVPTTKEARVWAARITQPPENPQRRILLHLGATWQGCGLSEEHLVALAGRIHADFPNTTLLITAGPADASYLAAMRSNFSEVVGEETHVFASPKLYPRALLFSGLSFGLWSALIESATVVVTPDTGAVHLASAHRRPVVAVYAPERFNAMTSLFGPWETPCRTLRGGGEREALSMKILASIRTLLAPPDSIPPQ